MFNFVDFAFHSSGGYSKCFWLISFQMRRRAALGSQFAILISSVKCQIGKKRWDKNIPLDDFRSYFSTCALALKLSKRLICASAFQRGGFFRNLSLFYLNFYLRYIKMRTLLQIYWRHTEAGGLIQIKRTVVKVSSWQEMQVHFLFDEVTSSL